MARECEWPRAPSSRHDPISIADDGYITHKKTINHEIPRNPFSYTYGSCHDGTY
jgi:hypothetical protein